MTKEEQNQYSKDVYYWRKEHKICAYCGKEPADPKSVYCSTCKENKRRKNLERYHNLPKEKKQEINERANKRYHDRRAKKLCAWCGEPTGGPIYCEKHREEHKLQQKECRKRKLLKELETLEES